MSTIQVNGGTVGAFYVLDLDPTAPVTLVDTSGKPGVWSVASFPEDVSSPPSITNPSETTATFPAQDKPGTTYTIKRGARNGLPDQWVALVFPDVDDGPALPSAGFNVLGFDPKGQDNSFAGDGATGPKLLNAYVRAARTDARAAAANAGNVLRPSGGNDGPAIHAAVTAGHVLLDGVFTVTADITIGGASAGHIRKATPTTRIQPAFATTVTLDCDYDVPDDEQLFDISLDGAVLFGPYGRQEATGENFGASRDGATNDAPAIQAAVNALANAGGGTVKHLRGTYAIHAALTLPSDIKVRGAGRLGTILLPNGNFPSVQFDAVTQRCELWDLSIHPCAYGGNCDGAVDFSNLSEGRIVDVEINGTVTHKVVGFLGTGDVTGNGPYYNQFIGCAVNGNTVSGSYGYSLQPNGTNPNFGPNANQIIGGHVTGVDSVVRLDCGTMNYIDGVVSESIVLYHYYLGAVSASNTINVAYYEPGIYTGGFLVHFNSASAFNVVSGPSRSDMGFVDPAGSYDTGAAIHNRVIIDGSIIASGDPFEAVGSLALLAAPVISFSTPNYLVQVLETGAKLSLGLPNLTFTEGVGPSLGQDPRTTHAPASAFAIASQTPYASATGTNRDAKDIVLTVPSPASGGADGELLVSISGADAFKATTKGVSVGATVPAVGQGLLRMAVPGAGNNYNLISSLDGSNNPTIIARWAPPDLYWGDGAYVTTLYQDVASGGVYIGRVNAVQQFGWGAGFIKVGTSTGGYPTAGAIRVAGVAGGQTVLAGNVNAGGTDLKMVSQDSSDRVIVGDATNAAAVRLLGANVTLFNTVDVGGGVGVVALADCGTVPTVTPTGGGILYVQAGALKYLGSSGTVTPIAPA